MKKKKKKKRTIRWNHNPDIALNGRRIKEEGCRGREEAGGSPLARLGYTIRRSISAARQRQGSGGVVVGIWLLTSRSLPSSRAQRRNALTLLLLRRRRDGARDGKENCRKHYVANQNLSIWEIYKAEY